MGRNHYCCPKAHQFLWVRLIRPHRLCALWLPHRETPVNCFKGIWVNAFKGMWPIVQLKCLCNSACSMGNKQEDFVAAAQM